MSTPLLQPSLQKNDRLAAWLIISFSIVVFAVVAALGRLPRLEVDLGFNPHVFAQANAIINTLVSLLLICALWLVKQRRYIAHRNVMYAAMVLSIVFLVSYIAHHLLTGDTHFGDLDHDGILSATELAAVKSLRLIYFILLSTHILLASVILPFILYTAYRGMSGDYAKHKKLARYTWPLWLYVSVTGPIVYLMIAPYYS
jgi:putative membrane protein